MIASIRHLLLCLLVLAEATTARAQTWATKPSGTTASLVGVWAPNATTAWVVGFSGTILKWDGTAWSSQASGTAQILTGVWGTSTSNVWAVGFGGTILHYDGLAWSSVTSPVSSNLSGIYGYDASNIWAVGDGGKIIKWNGTTWTTQTSNTTSNLVGISGTDTSNIWAVGASGTIVKFDGTNWATQSSGTSALLVGVYAAGTSNVFAVGTAGLIIHYDGTSWSSQTSGVATDMRGIWGVTPNHIWASANGGKMVFWNGSAWTLQTVPTTQNLGGISGNPLLDVWSVGSNGTIIRFTPAANALYTYTFTFTPAGGGSVEYTVGTTKGILSDDDVVGTKTVKLPATYVTFKVQPLPGYTLSTISSPQMSPPFLHKVGASPLLDPVNPLTPTFGFNVNATRTLQLVYTGKAEEPTASYTATSPPEGKATPVSSATGNYNGTSGIRRYNFDLATDETGKFTGIGQVEGLATVTSGTPPTSSPDLNLGGTMGTVSGKPNASVTGSFSGTLDSFKPGAVRTGSMSMAVPLDPQPTLTSKLIKGTGSAGPKPFTVANVNVSLPGPTGGATRSWSYTMDIVEKADSKGVKGKYATCVLTLPTGDKILFPQKPITYAAKTGYSIACTAGVKLDGTGAPILAYDTQNKLITISKTTLTFTNLKFTKSGAKWSPSAGTVKYTFLGQTGTGNVVDFGVQ